MRHSKMKHSSTPVSVSNAAGHLEHISGLITCVIHAIKNSSGTMPAQRSYEEMSGEFLFHVRALITIEPPIGGCSSEGLWVLVDEEGRRLYDDNSAIGIRR